MIFCYTKTLFMRKNWSKRRNNYCKYYLSNFLIIKMLYLHYLFSSFPFLFVYELTIFTRSNFYFLNLPQCFSETVAFVNEVLHDCCFGNTCLENKIFFKWLESQEKATEYYRKFIHTVKTLLSTKKLVVPVQRLNQ